MPILGRMDQPGREQAPAEWSRIRAPSLISRRALRTTPAFETYWRFAVERQEIFFRRLLGDPAPWTEDPVMRSYRFTNAYRASDRVSQYLINRVIRDSASSPEDIFFRVLLFKVFNRVGTWEFLQGQLGELRAASFEPACYDAVLNAARAQGHRIYSAAYIMPVPRLGGTYKHTNHLLLLKRMLTEELPGRIAAAPTMKVAYEMLVQYPSIGPFLAYQYVTDLNYSALTAFSEMDFVVAGPGAVDGIRKCFLDTGDLDDADVIRAVGEMAELQFKNLGLAFPSLWGRSLQLIDYQNLFCEVGKYARVVHPLLAGTSGRRRIKQKYRRPNTSPAALGYPDKWGLPRATVSVDGRTIPYPVPASEDR
jgi:alpha-glutamyl/putrescinyl thymine pyrophosphorylase clade 1